MAKQPLKGSGSSIPRRNRSDIRLCCQQEPCRYLSTEQLLLLVAECCRLQMGANTTTSSRARTIVVDYCAVLLVTLKRLSVLFGVSLHNVY